MSNYVDRDKRRYEQLVSKIEEYMQNNDCTSMHIDKTYGKVNIHKAGQEYTVKTEEENETEIMEFLEMYSCAFVTYDYCVTEYATCKALKVYGIDNIGNRVYFYEGEWEYMWKYPVPLIENIEKEVASDNEPF